MSEDLEHEKEREAREITFFYKGAKVLVPFALCLMGMAICSGFGFYNIDSMLILAVLGNGTALLGLDAAYKIKTNQEKEELL